jgi:DNA-binding MarR family transcriptional regulator
MQRDFKGVWIPKELWCSKLLSIQEKFILLEIYNLESAEYGCYASNKHFSGFINLSVSRVSELIANLRDKGLIKITYRKTDEKNTVRYIAVTEEGRELVKGITRVTVIRGA